MRSARTGSAGAGTAPEGLAYPLVHRDTHADLGGGSPGQARAAHRIRRPGPLRPCSTQSFQLAVRPLSEAVRRRTASAIQTGA
ncbi:hypothetical protein GCM10027440_17620 [Nocardiopsis coralliicola]